MTNDDQTLVSLPSPTHRPARLWPLWVGLSLAILAVAAIAVYGTFQLKQIHHSAQTQQLLLNQLQNRENNRSGTLKQIDNRLTDQLTKLNNQLKTIEKTANKQAQQIDHNAMTLAQVGGSSRTDWLMAEAEYLLRLANQRITMEHDPQGAEAILKAADSVLAETRDPGIYPVRKLLAKEQLSLQSVNLIDREGIYLQLEALINLIDHLNQRLFIKKPSPKTSISSVQSTQTASSRTQPPTSSWQNFWQDTFQLLKQNLVIRRLDKPVEPLLSPEQTFYLKQNLILMLEQAELALLKKNQPFYQKTLLNAQHWVKQYFLARNPVTKTFLSRISTLLKININPKLPDISASLMLLKEQVNLMYRQHLLTPATSPSASASPSGVQ